MLIDNDNQIILLKEAGRRLSSVLDELCKMCTAGNTSKDLDKKAESLIRIGGDKPAFLGYTPRGAKEPYPATLCVSINEEVVHGIPKERKLMEGDIVGLDIGLVHEGYIVDMARTVVVGEEDQKTMFLLKTTRNALERGISEARVGNKIGAISNAIEKVVKNAKLGLVTDLGGHGVGRAVHEEPFIPNHGDINSGPSIEKGMVLAIEPMVTEGGGSVSISSDGYTVVTRDGSRSAHFEHTILVTDGDPIILTSI